MRRIPIIILTLIFVLSSVNANAFWWKRESSKDADLENMQERFKWWPTDATPGPVKDEARGGYWWWPTTPGEAAPWGNRGYVYVYKIIFDYKEEDLPAPKLKELRPSLIIRNIIKNVKIYYDYDKSGLRDDAIPTLDKAVKSLKQNPDADILITGNCDRRGSEAHNNKLGKARGETVKRYMIDSGIDESRIIIVSRGKLDAVAPVTDLVGMQKERNAQFMVAEVEEVMMSYEGDRPSPDAKQIEKGKFLIDKEEEVSTPIKASTREYTVQKDDTLWKIAAKEYGAGYRWKYLYELNKDRINNPDKLKAGLKILIPVE
ncbi:MAG: hypothetical protein AUJ75_04235 [Candidatus Omnitrophica bacterium CG1_02_49_10]|nr:MAG: hypothetical protein AUJ75_04235 [Candidatus Omnitrophica bacterium CG1_02_49_10]